MKLLQKTEGLISSARSFHRYICHHLPTCAVQHWMMCSWPLPAKDYQWLAGKLALQVPKEIVLLEVCKNLDGQLQRLHVLTKKDICNTERAFYPNRPERQHTDDALVGLYSGKENGPILAYAEVPKVLTSYLTMLVRHCLQKT